MALEPGVVRVDGPFVFPIRHHGDPWVPVDVPIHGWGLANLDPAGGKLVIPIRTWGVPDENFNWSYTAWWIASDYTVNYTGRDETHIRGVTRYPTKGRIENNVGVQTGYYNPNAYYVPVAPGDPVPPGGDPAAVPGQDPTTVDPPPANVYVNRPYHYADLLVYDFMGKNRTGFDLTEDPTAPGTFLDPYDADDTIISFFYDDQSEDSNLKHFTFSPDGEETRNQQVALMSATKEGARGIRKIARNVNSWKEIGVFSGWDSVGGTNVSDVSADTVAGYAMAEVERRSRAPSFCKLTLPTEPAAGWPAHGEPGWRPMPFRDFQHGDRILGRCRIGLFDTGTLILRIVSMKIGSADRNNNVKVELECSPHVTDLSEITVS